MKTPLKTALLLACLCLLGVACSGLAAPASTPSPEPTPAPQSIEVQGHHLSIQCMGEGSPVVVLESGLGVYSGTWYKVFPEVAKFTRVCRYDRFGLGTSDPIAGPRTSERMVAELHELLARTQVPAPYILVGHSLGGLNIRLFASRYPAEVAGLIFLDAIHPDLDTRIEEILSPAQAQQRREELEMNPEGIKFADILASEDHVRSAGPVPDIPIIVIRHGLPFEGSTDWPTEKVEALWEELQADLAALGPQGKVIVAENSHHRIQEDRSDLVVATIREIFDQVKRSP